MLLTTLMTSGGGNRRLEMTKDEIGGESWPGGEVALFDGANESGDNWAEDCTVKKGSKVGLGGIGADGTSGGRWRLRRRASGDGGGSGFWSKRYVPKTILVSLSFDDNITILDDVYMILGEKGSAIIVTELSDGDKRSRGETIEDMSGGGSR